MDERTNALVRTLKDRMDREAELFADLGREVERLRDSFQQKSWGPSLSLAEGIERSSRAIEEADAARDEAFARGARRPCDLPRETTMSALLPGAAGPAAVRDGGELARPAHVRRAAEDRDGPDALLRGGPRVHAEQDPRAGLPVPQGQDLLPPRHGHGVSGAVLVDRRL